MDIAEILFAKKLAGGGGGGGGSNLTLLAKQSFAVKTSSTSVTDVGTIACGSEAWNKNAVIWVHVRPHSGRKDYAFYGTDTFFVNTNAANEQTTALTVYGTTAYAYSTMYSNNMAAIGVYADTIDSTGDIAIKAKYNSSGTRTIDDTFDVSVYAITLPNDEPMFI